jgi:hypothetical protein
MQNDNVDAKKTIDADAQAIMYALTCGYSKGGWCNQNCRYRENSACELTETKLAQMASGLFLRLTERIKELEGELWAAKFIQKESTKDALIHAQGEVIKQLEARLKSPYGDDRRVDEKHFAVVEHKCTEIYSHDEYYATPIRKDG